MSLTVLDHPLAAHLVAGLRDKATGPERYRHLTRELTTILALEATRGIRTKQVQIATPLEATTVSILDQGLAVVPILRAGLGMLDPITELFPDVSVGYIGLERNHDTAIAHSYYCKLPDLHGKYTLCVDPMLATGGSASQAINLIKGHGAANVVMMCVVAAPEGVEKIQHDHPEVEIVTAAYDRGLNSKKYILPGLGDFGDRLFGTM
ncbi:MAG TPA: uracil phosphoribosyltransferase [Fimbriimonadaceae bacterium]|nr:uracil phosphoribosyltransferase [Fimbriimonadaceae bacterium]